MLVDGTSTKSKLLLLIILMSKKYWKMVTPFSSVNHITKSGNYKTNNKQSSGAWRALDKSGTLCGIWPLLVGFVVATTPSLPILI